MSSLRRRLEEPGIIVAPGAADALSASLVEQQGFPAIYLSGAGVSYTLLAKPDIGLVTQSEMAQRLDSIARAVGIPVIADGDNGHGNALNVIRTVESFERAGAAAIQLEDQAFPKRCGHLAGKRLVPAAEMAGKIRAACAARTSPGFLVIGRTDARSVLGMDEALRRAELYLESGADILFVESPESREELRRVAETFRGVPLVANMVEGGRTPPVPASELEELGYSIAIYPNSLIRCYMHAGRVLLEHLREYGTTEGMLDSMLLFKGLNRLLGSEEMGRLEDEFVHRETT